MGGADKKSLYKKEKWLHLLRLNFHSPQRITVIYTPYNRDYPPELVKALEIRETLIRGKDVIRKPEKVAHFHDMLVVSENKWNEYFYKQFTPIDCNDPTPEGYQKMFLAGGRRKNKSRRNKRKNRKTRRH